MPGSKSITNRALALAALSDGSLTLTGALFADDTQRMQDCLKALGFTIDADPLTATITVQGEGGTIPTSQAELFVGNSGTTARFISPIAALGQGTFHLDGVARMRERPIGDLVQSLEGLGVAVDCPTGCPPLTIHAKGLHGGSTTIRADASSQFLSGLLLAAPFADAEETIIQVEGPVLSAPYVRMTQAMLTQFGLSVQNRGQDYRVPGRQQVRRRELGLPQIESYAIEPDASAASYFFAAAALTGGWVRIYGLGPGSLQGDTQFVRVLEAMGCEVVLANGAIDVHGPEQLTGITLDMNAISDTVMTLAAIAPFASTPTVIENVGHIRHKETDRLAAVVAELTRLGVDVEERPDGLTIYPAKSLRPATIQTYDDHRMAMAFAITGLRSPGIVIDNPACVAKTFPDFFECLEELCGAG
ncbi:3-phosphoshikimate 1-carboxyvinyltransferase [Armatimonas sp.]|uniref:3-phosphoshikimate 1-carboxyvinyltransferase n=1 Tax=Armatimonas sp. TaxID=1872638 RepID=UPI0037516F19